MLNALSALSLHFLSFGPEKERADGTLSSTKAFIAGHRKNLHSLPVSLGDVTFSFHPTLTGRTTIFSPLLSLSLLISAHALAFVSDDTSRPAPPNAPSANTNSDVEEHHYSFDIEVEDSGSLLNNERIDLNKNKTSQHLA